MMGPASFIIVKLILSREVTELMSGDEDFKGASFYRGWGEG